jgi:hypothetical protein
MLPSPQAVVMNAPRRRHNVAWYGGGRRDVEVVSGCGHWYKGGAGLVTVTLPVPTLHPTTPRPQSDDRLPPPGTILSRPYKGRTLQVQVLTEGFAFEGQVYPSLSAVAKAATGSHCNGYLFFRTALNNQEQTA